MIHVFAWVIGRLELLLGNLEELRIEGYDNQGSIKYINGPTKFEMSIRCPSGDVE